MRIVTEPILEAAPEPAWEGAIAESAVRRDWGFRIRILVLGASLEGVDGHTRRRALSPLTIGGGHAGGSACGAVVVWCKLYFLRFFWACRYAWTRRA